VDRPDAAMVDDAGRKRHERHAEQRRANPKRLDLFHCLPRRCACRDNARGGRIVPERKVEGRKPVPLRDSAQRGADELDELVPGRLGSLSLARRGWGEAMAQVSLQSVVKRFGDTDAVRGIDLEIADEELVVLVGPSGCGKSTTLRLIAGLEELTSGEIYIGGELVNDLPPRERDIAMVFQNYALYPHMTVFENMSFGLRLKHFPKEEIKRRVDEAARVLDIADLLSRRPKQLSGGQRQRVAMGRAIVRNPKVFLFDEPLSNLDAKLRVQMRTEIKKVHQKVRTTSVYVTHDQIEAMTLADRVVVMNKGRIEQVGPPNELYHRPKTRFVAGFIGSPAMNFLACRLVETGAGLAVALENQLALPVPPARFSSYRPHLGRSLVLGLRPEHITECRPYGEGAEFSLPVEVVEPMGTETLIHLEVAGAPLCARCSPEVSAAPGAPMPFMAQMQHMHLIDPASDEVIAVG
jgi:multiple sugar transport system ATP-binding protein